MNKFVLTVTALLVTLTSFAGDILILNNERVFDGKVTKIKNCEVVFMTAGNKYKIPAADILAIEFADPTDKVYTKYMELASEDPNNCLQGNMDAENLHGKKGAHFALGFLFGPFALVGTALANPTPMKGKDTYMLSKNRELFDDPEYLICYRKKARAKLIAMEALGWGTAIVLIAAQY